MVFTSFFSGQLVSKHSGPVSNVETEILLEFAGSTVTGIGNFILNEFDVLLSNTQLSWTERAIDTSYIFDGTGTGVSATDLQDNQFDYLAGRYVWASRNFTSGDEILRVSVEHPSNVSIDEIKLYWRVLKNCCSVKVGVRDYTAGGSYTYWNNNTAIPAGSNFEGPRPYIVSVTSGGYSTNVTFVKFEVSVGSGSANRLRISESDPFEIVSSSYSTLEYDVKYLIAPNSTDTSLIDDDDFATYANWGDNVLSVGDDVFQLAVTSAPGDIERLRLYYPSSSRHLGFKIYFSTDDSTWTLVHEDTVLPTRDANNFVIYDNLNY